MTATTNRINPADHLPDYVSPAQVKGLLGPVDIWRDAWGIPHVRGGTLQDAFAGLGFAQAQDRLWQMEALLRRGTGRYAEWLGARAVAGDTIARQMNGDAASRRERRLRGSVVLTTDPHRPPLHTRWGFIASPLVAIRTGGIWPSSPSCSVARALQAASMRL